VPPPISLLTRFPGANSALGIGRATVHQFAQNGAKAIFVCDFTDQLLAVHKRELNSLYPKTEIHTRQFDAGDEASVKKVVEEALDKYGRLDVFFANAGIAGGKMFTETTSEEFMNMMRVNTLRYLLTYTRYATHTTDLGKTASSLPPSTQQRP